MEGVNDIMHYNPPISRRMGKIMTNHDQYDTDAFSQVEYNIS